MVGVMPSVLPTGSILFYDHAKLIQVNKVLMGDSLTSHLTKPKKTILLSYSFHQMAHICANHSM